MVLTLKTCLVINQMLPIYHLFTVYVELKLIEVCLIKQLSLNKFLNINLIIV